jgi:hypothetical protein
MRQRPARKRCTALAVSLRMKPPRCDEGRSPTDIAGPVDFDRTRDVSTREADLRRYPTFAAGPRPLCYGVQVRVGVSVGTSSNVARSGILMSDAPEVPACIRTSSTIQPRKPL